MWTNEEMQYMRMAMELAEKGCGFVNPNPMVGAVIVKDGEIIGKGWHTRYGHAHAEREALSTCSGNPQGSRMYVTLEPCCHYGKQPPCTEAILEAGISEVIVGMQDPNPLVSGKGIAVLRDAGVMVRSGLLEDDIRFQNRVFVKYIRTGIPWVAMKSAMTMDGKTATASGHSKWVTGEESRQYVQILRSRYSAIMAGRGTVSADDPMLNCRLEGMRSPVRILPDSMASLRMDSGIVRTAGQYRTLLFHTARADYAKLAMLRDAGIETVVCNEVLSEGRIFVDPEDMLRKTGDLGIDSVLLEGGAELNWSFVSRGLTDEYYLFYAPKISGGKNAPSSVGGDGFDRMDGVAEMDIVEIMRTGNDILVHGIAKEQVGCLQE